MSYVETNRCVHTARFDGADGLVSLLRDISNWYKRQKPEPVVWHIEIDHVRMSATVYHDGFEPR